MHMTRLNRWQGITLASLFVGYTGYYVCRSNLSVAAPILLAEFADSGLTKDRLGAIQTAGLLFYVIGKLSNGVLGDYLGGRRLFLIGMVASSLCTVIFGLSSGIAMFAIAWAANRFFQSMGWGAMVKTAGCWFPYRLHATVMGILAVSYLLGDAAGRLYLGWFLEAGIGWRGLFGVAAASLYSLAIICFFTLRGTPRDIGEQEPAANPINVFGETDAGTASVSFWQLLGPLLGNPTFWIVCIMNAGLTLIRETFNFWIPTYLTEVTAATPAQAALSSTIFPFVGAWSALLAGLASDRLKGRHGLVAFPSLVVLIGSLWLLASASLEGRPNLALVLLGGVSFFLMGPYSFCSGVMSLDLGGKRGSATAAGLIDGAGYFGALASGWGVGRIAQEYGWATAFHALAYIAGLVAVAAAIYWWRQESAKQVVTPAPVVES
jgi:OPA family glycerol-3-phosphate transporter-like MFS transporter